MSRDINCFGSGSTIVKFHVIYLARVDTRLVLLMGFGMSIIIAGIRECMSGASNSVC